MRAVIAIAFGQTSSVPSSLDCNFETGFCNWQQSLTDNFNWTRTNVRSPSFGTGPFGDHTTGTGNIFLDICESFISIHYRNLPL